MFQVGGAVGAFLLGRLFDRSTSYRALAWVYLGASVCVFFIGMAGSSVALQAFAVFAAGVCVVGGQTGSNAMAAQSYPTSVRSTGVGWALGIGRIGSIVGPVAGGMLLSSHLPMKRVFWAAALPPLIALLAAAVLNQRMGSGAVKQSPAAV
jgi:AAHS family 4-hydroxybenzoate transporter-like MFS transporter